jgi:hypothetical protein
MPGLGRLVPVCDERDDRNSGTTIVLQIVPERNPNDCCWPADIRSTPDHRHAVIPGAFGQH